jgi:hypothetical protein
MALQADDALPWRWFWLSRCNIEDVVAADVR